MLGPLVLTGADDAAPVSVGALTRTNPDVVVILTDDQRTDTLLSMPSVRRLLVDRGTRFTEAHVPNSLCCPSRSTILTGLYSHDTGVWTNGGPNGGWLAFVKHGNEKRTIAVNLQRAGYRTALIGKYLNAYGHYAPAKLHTRSGGASSRPSASSITRAPTTTTASATRLSTTVWARATTRPTSWPVARSTSSGRPRATSPCSSTSRPTRPTCRRPRLRATWER